jgi:hypothetical protein
MSYYFIISFVGCITIVKPVNWIVLLTFRVYFQPWKISKIQPDCWQKTVDIV